uniref:Fibronectin type-III domain-containing protein n=1 Tax=Entomoneis paludosa TaxID=265537 RepID=A0A7S3DNU3_9STRA|mmetsp:Transcript_24417/g.50745  ORF Transcript_24417/g.50745 Transcript_24417/m.50745 type:complete len:259 (+) Transcript_24417:75-851(+)|eukprot:CAMPEP_0172451000 /NCGR_PEP_ID=MMETSP1065-20121228/9177_1 /TAXON_ID=265537 /ORGANISM="Amphiprora paludosa, Strain CCMP125" /LENGTH=258 /DNA_ID=CAMNT_0013202881 /DNA_START=21 /DNA_END=797 /DNA_ORIENTATION=-
MKITLTYTILASCACMASAFAPVQPRSMNNVFCVKKSNTKMFMSEESIDEEVERMVQEEVATKQKISNLRNANGVEYAPWMNISKEDEQKIRAMMRDKAEARRRRQLQEQDVQGALLNDSQAQELSGTGLRSKIVDGNCVELEWATNREASTDGFVIKRRAAKTPDFEVIASYETYGPLASKGIDGGVYRFMDEDLAPGGYFYRVTECESNGAENDLSQCLVEIQTEEEQRGAVIAAAAVGIVLVGLVVAGSLLDPIQ